MIDSPPEPPPRIPFSFVVAWTIFALTVFLFGGFAAQMLQMAWGLWFSELIIFVGLAVIGFQVVGLAPLRAMGLHRFQPRAFGWGFGLGVVNYVAWAVPLMAAAEAIFPKELVEQADSSRIFERVTPVELSIILLAVTIAAPLGEELFFRGFFQRGLALNRGAPRAIVVSAFVFSAFHLDVVGLTARFELGVLFGILAWRSGSLWPAIGAHAANNFVSSMLFLAFGHAKEEQISWQAPVVMLIVGNLALYTLVRLAWDRLPVREPMALVEVPPKAPGRLFLPWLGAALASIALLLVVDLRGVQLNLIDLRLQPGETLRARDDVKALRARVRRGEAALQDYELRMKELTSSGR